MNNSIDGISETESGNMPLVTVITPAYNREALIEETILSVLKQDYPNIEYIVLDDGSTDNTLQIIKKHQDKLRWVTHENLGETRTVNKGFSMVRGEIIGVVNSDDPLLPGAVSKLVETLVKNSGVVVVYPDWEMIDERGRVIQTMRSYDFTSYADMVRKHFCLPGPGAFFRREMVEKIGGRDPEFRYVADLEFWFRAGILGSFMRVPEVLATFRVHAGSATVSQRGSLMAVEHVALIEKLYSLPEIPESAQAVKKEALSSAFFVAGANLNKGAFFDKVKYFSKAIYLCPHKYFWEYKRRILMMVLLLLGIPGDRAYNFLIRFRRNKLPVW